MKNSLEKEFLNWNDGIQQWEFRYTDAVNHQEELSWIEKRQKDSIDRLQDSVKSSWEWVIDLLDERGRLEKEIFYLWADKWWLNAEVTTKDSLIDEL